MPKQRDQSCAPSRIADRLAAARRKRFIGRATELALFRAALQETEPPFTVLYLHGPGGVGKTTLLQEYARIAAENGLPAALLDGRNVDASPSGFFLALNQVLGRGKEDAPLELLVQKELRLVLLLDSYETLALLDAWLRETFLPQLPEQSLVVLASRNPPNSTWRADLEWAEVTRIISLRNFAPQESRSYLAIRGVPVEQQAAVLTSTHGHPLALSLGADVVKRDDSQFPFNLQNNPDVVRVLLERFVQGTPSPHHHLALEVCALTRATTEDLLAEIFSEAAASTLFTWLRELSFIEQGPRGLFPHDLAREVLDADLRWRNPERYRRLYRRLRTYLLHKFEQASGIEQQHIRLDITYLNRHGSFMKPYLEWNALDSAYAESATGRDYPGIVEMVRRHEGEESARIAQYWLVRQPHAFQVLRTWSGELIGFLANLTLHQTTPEDLAADPAVSAALHFVRRHGPVRLGEEITHLRFWMGRETHQAAGLARSLTANSAVIYWTTTPALAWNFIATADPDSLQSHFHGISMQRSPEADFQVGERRYGVFSHDWRVEPVSMWRDLIAERVLAGELNLEEPPIALPPPLLVLSQTEFAEAVRQALRDYTRPDLLAASPLIRSRIVVEKAGAEQTSTTLQTLLHEAANSLTANPKDEKLHRAIRRTYLEPAPTQESTAELLGLPFSTYRYHLTSGVKRIVDWLWLRELHGFAEQKNAR